MDFLSLAKQRCSMREFKDIQVESEKLDKIIEAAHVAPTAANMQSQRLLVVKSDEGLGKLSKAVNFHGAPLAIIVCGDYSEAFVRPFDQKNMAVIDATIVADHIVMEAEDLGLSSCWMTLFRPDVVREEFKIPVEMEPVAIIAIGYANVQKASADRHLYDRKSISEIVFSETF